MSSKIKEEKKKKKRKTKRRKEKRKAATLYLETRARSRGLRRKSLKPGALSLSWLGAIDLVLATWVDG